MTRQEKAEIRRINKTNSGGGRLRILGVDPGYGRTGYGVIESQGHRLVPVEYGLIETQPKQAMEVRLRLIYDQLTEVCRRTSPDQMAVEQLYFNRNVTTAIAVGQARGVILLVGAQHNLRISEYTPMQVKQAVTGYGSADKKQMQEMVRILLGLQEPPRPDDVADAVAIAITHLHTAPLYDAVQRGGKRN
ncbi:MAG: crossover junction endodeoxyribonuclease RuvC [Bacilli bacterium]|nr:crossover junction endodeoxyribonuclease RuvC [Bacilli bacterium]